MLQSDLVSFGVTFVFHILPAIVFFGALMSVLYHLGLIHLVVRVMAWGMQRIMGTSGAESLSAAGNIFVGQTEAPLLIRPYVDKMTMSELMAVMCGGFATVAGGVLAAYVRFGINAGYLLAASVMSAPVALVAAKILYPETEVPETAGRANHKVPSPHKSPIADSDRAHVRRVAGCGPAQKMPRRPVCRQAVQGVFEHGTQVAAIRA